MTHNGSGRTGRRRCARPSIWQNPMSLAAIRQPPMRVNIKWRSGEGAGRARLSETAGSSANHRPVSPNAWPLATVLGLSGCSYVRDPAVSERRALPAPFARPPLYVDAHGRPADEVGSASLPTSDLIGVGWVRDEIFLFDAVLNLVLLQNP